MEMKSSEYKEKAVDRLENVVYWMRKSNFDYEIKDLKKIFDNVLSEYLVYRAYKENHKHYKK